jgi:lipopolysaccharide transport system permease protein
MFSSYVKFFVLYCIGLMSKTNQLNPILPSRTADLGHLTPETDSGLAEVETVIRARPGWISVNWAELVQSHELFYTLVQRDLMVRYKQSVLGVAWALIQPFLTMLVFTVIFGRVVGIKTDVGPNPVPYSLFLYVALVPWLFFSNAVTGASLSLLNNQNLLTKIYFPRLYVPAAAVGGFLVDMAIGLGLLALMMPFYHYGPSWSLLALPLVIVLTFAATLGIGLTLAAMTILYRDLRFVIPFVLQLMMFVSGVFVKMDGHRWPIRYAAALNPMFGIINAYRSSILGTPWDFGTLAVSTLSTVVLLTFGLFFFRKTERLIADIA